VGARLVIIGASAYIEASDPGGSNSNDCGTCFIGTMVKVDRHDTTTTAGIVSISGALARTDHIDHLHGYGSSPPRPVIRHLTLTVDGTIQHIEVEEPALR
jgi:hypothetical protein